MIKTQHSIISYTAAEEFYYVQCINDSYHMLRATMWTSWQGLEMLLIGNVWHGPYGTLIMSA